MSTPSPPHPHVVMVPFPAQGHVSIMLKLSELLCYASIHVTFLVADNMYGGLLRNSARFESYRGRFRFESVPDGSPDDGPKSGEKFRQKMRSFSANAKPFLREFLLKSNCWREDSPATCLILDGFMSYGIDDAEEIGIPVILFRTSSACCFLAYFLLPELVEAGQLPFKDDSMDAVIENIPGMNHLLRGRDLPSICRTTNLSDPVFQWIVYEAQQTTRANGMIFNTFEELEGPVLAQLRTKYPQVYTIGPFDEYLGAKLKAPVSSHTLLEEDVSCLVWLDAQPTKSVVYVSFGSIATINKDQLVEFWHGLMDSGKQFLWVIRPDSISDGGHVPTELLEDTKDRGYIVRWAPQKAVLAHQAVGGFLTHSGWNSTLESMVGGVPMICWPCSADQQINSRFVEQIWKLGLDMKDTCDRVIIAEKIRDLMDVRGDVFVRSAKRMSEMAREAVAQGGSSYSNLNSLIEDIKSICFQD